MNFATFVGLLITLSLTVLTVADDLPQWTSSSGSKIRADILSVDNQNRTVTLLVPKVVAFDQLDAESLAQARRLLKAREATAESVASTAEPMPVRKHGIGRSQRQLLSALESTFRNFENDTLSDGRPRRMSQAADNMSSFELIGDPNSPDSATLLIGLPNDAPDVVVRNSAMLLRFIKNALPRWTDSTDWVSESLDTHNRRMDGKPISKIVGDLEISINVMHNISMCTATIKAK